MKKCISIIFIGALLSILFNNSQALATSWVELDPNEVNKRAEIIVYGQYDFSSKPQGREMVFTSYEFNIKKVYKGDVPNKIRAGIDEYDTGWADGFQKEGGEFLLFLEKSKGASFLTPVGGPNGMIQISNGIVEHHNNNSKVFYEDFLKTQTEKPIVKTSNEAIQNQDNRTLYSSLIVLFIGMCCLLFVWQYKRNAK